jgi:uncharacterized protein YkwD
MWRGAAALVAIGCSLAALAAIPAAASPTGSDRVATLEQAVLREMNQARATRGLKPLTLARGLRASAVAHSRAMLAGGFFQHESANGGSFWLRIKKTYPPPAHGAWSVGENLFMKSAEPTAHETVETWLASPAHRSILLSGRWKDVGVGVIFGQAGGVFGGTTTWLITADFGVRH